MVRIDHELRVYGGGEATSPLDQGIDETVRVVEDNGRLRNESASLRSQVEELRAQLRRSYAEKAEAQSHVALLIAAMTKAKVIADRVQADARETQLGLSDSLRAARLWSSNG